MADVYLNGKLLGEHRGGFGAFCFEITTNLSASGTNLLAVRVDNTKCAGHRAVERRFFGLWRTLSSGAFDRDGRARISRSPITARPASRGCKRASRKQQAVLDVTAQISNGTKQKQPLTLIATVLDADGNPVATAVKKKSRSRPT